ncbi:MAG TPA: c-type cytochrome, partial [Phenylobacterium sp.]|nr:c-type cytochrome [Phenylobacterium sp.]
LAFTIATLGVAAGLAHSAAAASASSIAAGREIAMNVCSACHAVSEHPEFPPLLDQPAPSFQVIADRPATTAASLRRYVTTTHWDETSIPMTMPNLMLQSDQADQVARYIISLRKVK